MAVLALLACSIGVFLCCSNRHIHEMFVALKVVLMKVIIEQIYLGPAPIPGILMHNKKHFSDDYLTYLVYILKLKSILAC
jgi:hypothetical protein